MSAQCPQCGQDGTWTGSSGMQAAEDGTPLCTDTYQCAEGHQWPITVTYE